MGTQTTEGSPAHPNQATWVDTVNARYALGRRSKHFASAGVLMKGWDASDEHLTLLLLNRSIPPFIRRGARTVASASLVNGQLPYIFLGNSDVHHPSAMSWGHAG